MCKYLAVVVLAFSLTSAAVIDEAFYDDAFDKLKQSDE
jgi:hypothetical protein